MNKYSNGEPGLIIGKYGGRRDDEIYNFKMMFNHHLKNFFDIDMIDNIASDFFIFIYKDRICEVRKIDFFIFQSSYQANNNPNDIWLVMVRGDIIQNFTCKASFDINNWIKENIISKLKSKHNYYSEKIELLKSF